MARLIVRGNKTLSGTLQVSGNKNAFLPMMCASLLTDEKTVLTGCPPITDAKKIARYFLDLGSSVGSCPNSKLMELHHGNADAHLRQAVLPAGIRSAVLLIAPMLHRFGEISIDIGSKGCALGIREIDPHVHIAEAFGCRAEVEGGLCHLRRPKTFQPADIWLDYQSVTATETFVMMAALTPGRSRLNNAACEPHVRDLCLMLEKMGAKISGIGTSALEVEGVGNLSGIEHAVPEDHHEIATYAAIGAATGSDLKIETRVSDDLRLIVRQFRKVGLNVWIDSETIRTGVSDHIVAEPFTPEGVTKVEAAPWPYFPADILPQIIAASIQARGEILFWNKVYEGALFWSPELAKFGARTYLSDPHRLVLLPASRLRPAVVEAPYIIRVVIGLVIAALQIDGTSEIRHADPISRAHPDFIEKLTALGADLEWAD
ncbi:UDP-N-acetylglucosamine 1-carboxyvinyltransferase [Roseibium sp. RKSG952]|uniref:UDP-N-acetylglucosamine 1-carboxyvinyltransferase n=1 Tax=Roseibium sp. RKSG952 TaxID=2529384 RepID=UPI0012BCFAE9|nr:UDP-N-acetylglucosamine 1-carboxyvinyltransferase [Roseibium sp. RKSG952]MTI01103.1 UDP-N-acetylglucosamine 1-carboxyvinyltransferase [Roseibium sp. RKSG952]